MANTTLRELYDSVLPECRDVYVVPLIRYKYKKSDYLYLLYRDMINSTMKPNINSTSAFNHLRFVIAALMGNKVILHYHWLEFQDFRALFGMPYKLTCIWLFKLFGGKLVWTIHNKQPHDRNFRRLNHIMRKRMAKKADALHVHCKTAIEIMSNHYGMSTEKFHVIAHPKYPSELIPRAAAIESLNQRFGIVIKSTDRIFLSFGQIVEYKQLCELVKMFIDLPKTKKLLIAGPVKKGHLSYYRKLKKLIGKSNPNVIMLPNFISEDSVPEFFNAADFTIFNYSDILTSGGVELARSFQKTVIVPNAGCLTELKGDPEVIIFENQDELSNILQQI
jgi:glycosyltransferase involved in cell wall biosynthesis